MKRSRYTEEQIIGILKEHQAGLSAQESVPQAWDQRRHVLQVAGQIWRHGRLGRKEAEGSGRGKPAS